MAKNFSAATMDSLAVLLIRVPLGVIFFAHGSQKLLGLFGGPGLTGTLRNFEVHMGIPPLLTLLAIIAEFGGGLGVLCGLFTRLSACGIAVTMAVAIYKVHWVNGFFLSASGKGNGIEYTLALLGMALALVVTGGGSWSLDRYIWKR
jgi:putative oxidoreductase